MRFQYSLIINISLIDWFLTLVFGIQIGMNERKKIHEQVFRKNSCLGKWIILGAKMAYPHNSGLALRFFFLILHSERGQQVDEKNIVFSKKNFCGANGLFSNQKSTSSQLWIHCKDCFTILYNEKGKERYRHYINCFSEKKSYSRQFCHFGPKLVHNLNVLNLLSGVFLIFCLIKGTQS